MENISNEENPVNLINVDKIKIERTNISFLIELGRTNFSLVYMTSIQKENEEENIYATKIIPNDLYNALEKIILKKIKDHENIVKFHYHHEDKEQKLQLLHFEYLETGLRNQMNERLFSEEEMQHIMKQLISALLYLKENNIIHGDIKPENIFLKNISSNTINILETQVKLIDFGLAQILQNGTITKAILGTKIYMAPEMLIAYLCHLSNPENSVFNYTKHSKTDIWSLGVIAYEMLFGKLPFDINKDIINMFTAGIFTFPSNIKVSNQCRSFINSMLQNVADKRISIEDLNNHEFLKGNVEDFQKDSFYKMNKEMQNKLNCAVEISNKNINNLPLPFHSFSSIEKIDYESKYNFLESKSQVPRNSFEFRNADNIVNSEFHELNKFINKKKTIIIEGSSDDEKACLINCLSKNNLQDENKVLEDLSNIEILTSNIDNFIEKENDNFSIFNNECNILDSSLFRRLINSDVIDISAIFLVINISNEKLPKKYEQLFSALSSNFSYRNNNVVVIFSRSNSVIIEEFERLKNIHIHNLKNMGVSNYIFWDSYRPIVDQDKQLFDSLYKVDNVKISLQYNHSHALNDEIERLQILSKKEDIIINGTEFAEWTEVEQVKLKIDNLFEAELDPNKKEIDMLKIDPNCFEVNSAEIRSFNHENCNAERTINESRYEIINPTTVVFHRPIKKHMGLGVFIGKGDTSYVDFVMKINYERYKMKTNVSYDPSEKIINKARENIVRNLIKKIEKADK